MNNTRTRTEKNKRSVNRSARPSSQARAPRKKAISSIDPKMLVRKSIATPPVEDAKPERTFNEMPIHERIKNNLVRKGFKTPTPIQHQTLEHLIGGRNLVGIANTGTGKTGAFLIPIIHQLLTNKPFTSLVVVPTRELALQVETEFKSLSNGMGFSVSCFIGGTSVERDVALLKRRHHMVIGTPGRLIDLVDRNALRLQDISVLVLDEFDRMLDMGFINDIKKIVKLMTRRQQTLLFSATVDHGQQDLIKSLVQDPIHVKVSSGVSTSDQIDQDIIRVPQGTDKFTLLLELISQKEFNKVLIFAETKRLVDRVAKKLNQSGVLTDLIHGNKSQNYRNKALDKFKRGKVQVLVATDVAARGIDVSDVTHVINYQLPLSFDNYIHRIGRTGRAGKTGKAFTFID